MELISEADFWAWATDNGIGPHPTFGKTGSLAFLSASNLWKPWMPPTIISDSPAFITAALDSAMPDGTFLLWRRGGGVWREGPDTTARNEAIDLALRGARVPPEHSGALRLSPASELPALWVIVLAFFVYGWGVGEDLYIIPENASCFLMVSHHGELIVTSPSIKHQNEFTSAMVRLGYVDQDSGGEPPDHTHT